LLLNNEKRLPPALSGSDTGAVTGSACSANLPAKNLPDGADDEPTRRQK
jgi:hypothetical protein